MFLSRLTLAADASHEAAFWNRLGDAYALHQEVWRLFAGEAGGQRPFLYRLDLHRGRPVLYTLSDDEPADPERLWRLDSKPFRPALAAGDRLAFALRANPTVKRDGKRHDVVMDAKTRLRTQSLPAAGRPSQAELVAEHAPPWLERRAERLGVTFAAVQADGYHIHQFPRPGRGGARPHKVTVATCDFQGLLCVEDPERFVAAVVAGIGPAKGFGCGLMLLRRAR